MDQELKQKLHQWQETVRHDLTHPTFPTEPAYLFEPMRYALNAAGKMLRPALCLAAAEAVGGQWQTAVQVGVALEIFHTFTLVHDDIMDGDELRRGIPTVHTAYDSSRALLSGDTLLIYVYQLLSEIDDAKFPQLFRAFNEGAMDVCRGQGWDMQFEKILDIESHEYEMMIDLKTGALIKLACQLGAIIGGGNQSAIDALSRYGLLLGRAFQMQDDLLEVTSSAEAMGKSLGSDVLNEKKTWLWIDLKKRLTPAEKNQWKSIQSSDKLNEADRDQVLLWMTSHGTIERAERLVKGWINEADELLNSASFKNTAMLKALSDLILNRQS
ncbi:MAG: polyprenyl synthetase family protein [Candidatus Marinimicrobia bacterium]|nr:polyprenyl synthetase family protein [Candidatus Neomarinimicrobiota bacterium]